MELEIITSREQIAELHGKFRDLIIKNSTGKKLKITLTTPSRVFDVNAYYNSKNKIFWSDDRLSKTGKFYNLIGLNPDFEKTNSMLLQINYQHEFVSFIEGACWGKDMRGRIYLLHNGKMGGGIVGIGKTSVHRIFAGQKASVVYKNKIKDCMVVCEINSRNAYTHFVRFINEIQKTKSILKGEATGSTNPNLKPSILKRYKPEFWGKREAYLREGKIIPNCDHGIVVDSLREKLESAYGFKGNCVSNGFVDLGIVYKGKPIAIFEIKTSSSTQYIYTAIGQLMLHSSRHQAIPNRFIVVPDDFDKETEKDLLLLNINTLRYKIVKDIVKFTNLDIIKDVR